MKFKMLSLCIAASALVACGGDDAEETPSNSVASISIEGDSNALETITTIVTDDNGVGPASSITYTWSLDGTVIDGEVSDELMLTTDMIGGIVTVVASFTDSDGYDESPTASTGAVGAVAATAATFSGLTASIVSDQTATLTGTVVITDVNEGEDLAVAQADTDTAFGSFSIEQDGTWSYDLDTTNDDVAALSSGEMLVDMIEIESFDGTTADLTITINGGDSSVTQVAQISDLNGLTNGNSDTGEVRYSLDTALTEGKLEVSFLKEAALNEDGSSRDAYITLYGPSSSSAEALIDLRIQESQFLVRGRDDLSSTFVADQWYDVEITWDVSEANQVTVLIDGVDVFGGAFETGALADPDVADTTFFAGGVTVVQFRFSDNDSIVPDGSYFIDDVAIYSDTAGTTEVFSDDFESYDEGFDLTPTDDGISPYNSNTFDSVVASVTAPDAVVVDDMGPGFPGNQTAQISDLGGASNASSDTGEVRYSLGTALTEGKLDVSFLKEVALNEDGSSRDAYITLYGPTTSSAEALIDLRIQESQFLVRGRDDLTSPFATDQWYDVEITWDVSAANQVTVLIDGVDVFGGAFETGALADPDVADSSFFAAGVTAVQFRFSDNDSIVPDGSYFVDEIAIYSDMAGTTEVFSDDFESYDEGFSLTPSDDGISPYNSNTVDAVVAVE